ncbi:MAG TPA: DUF6519 domain-containing protein [Vicinamibacterales bacterium]
MGTEDISRHATSRPKRYDGVRMQQGRVTTDDDFNEGARLVDENDRRTRLDVIGPAGTVDDGFRITNPRINAHDELDFDIGAGSYYVGGLRAEVNAPGEAYATQSDHLQQTSSDRPKPTDGRVDLVYLETWQQPVEAVEDSELFETALVGPDTATRVRTMRRVRVAPNVNANDCTSAWQSHLAALTATCGQLEFDTSECVPDTTLTVTFDNTGVTDDLCSPSIVGGYLGAENQAVRVQIVDITHFTWGFDNASPLYRVTVGADGVTVTLQTEPRDQAHWMQSGQIVEILPWSAVLSNGEKIAEQSGHLSKVAAAYDPNTRTLTLATALPAAPPPGFGLQWTTRDDAPALGARFFYMRVWARGGDTTSDQALAFAPGTPVTLGHTGLRVTLAGTVFVPGDHWIIAARPEDPTRVVPWDLLTGRAPHGVRRFYTPLALITWRVNGNDVTGTRVEDCRTVFDPLTRRRSCCTFTVGDGVTSRGHFVRIQDAIDALPATGGQVCILPGRYDQDFRIEGRVGITVEGCGRRTLIRGEPNGTTTAVVSVIDSERVALRSFAVASETRVPVQLVDRVGAKQIGLPNEIAGVPAADERGARLRQFLRLQRVRLERLLVSARDLSGIVVAGGRFIELLSSQISVGPLAVDVTGGQNVVAGRWPGVYVAADDVLIERCAVTAAEQRPSVRPIEDVVSAGRDDVGRPTGIGLFSSRLVVAVLTSATRLSCGGIQIAGGSERVEIRRNRITGGSGHGITLGSVAFVPAPVLTKFGATLDFRVLTAAWKAVAPGFNLVINENGCVGFDPDPTPPKDPAGNPRVPVSMGALADVRILDNDIRRMGQSGIGVALFFNLVRDRQLITVDRLTIEQNRISECLRAELPEIGGALRQFAGYGAIALADGERIVLRSNEIQRNGASHVDPICGIFVLFATGLLVEANLVRDNGPRTRSTAAARPGLRGGLVVTLARAPAQDNEIFDVADELLAFVAARRGRAGPPDVLPAARIHDNQVLCQDGAALILRAAGAVSVSRNALVSRGVTGLRTDLPNPDTGLVNLNAAELLFGAAVTVENLGVSSELGAVGSFTGLGHTALGATTVANVTARGPSGATLFEENQVLLDLQEAERRGLLMSTTTIHSLDDVGIADNQFVARTRDEILLTNLLAAAWSLRVTSNGIKEPLLRAFTSGFALGLLCTAALNQSTHCLLVVSQLGAEGRVNKDNRSLIDALSVAGGGRPFCPPDDDAP